MAEKEQQQMWNGDNFAQIRNERCVAACEMQKFICFHWPLANIKIEHVHDARTHKRN